MRTSGGKRYRIRPTRPVSAFAAAIGAVFVFLGVTKIIPMLADGGALWFGLLWTFLAATIVVVNVLNLLGVRPRALDWLYEWPSKVWGYQVEEIDERDP